MSIGPPLFANGYSVIGLIGGQSYKLWHASHGACVAVHPSESWNVDSHVVVTNLIFQIHVCMQNVLSVTSVCRTLYHILHPHHNKYGHISTRGNILSSMYSLHHLTALEMVCHGFGATSCL